MQGFFYQVKLILNPRKLDLSNDFYLLKNYISDHTNPLYPTPDKISSFTNTSFIQFDRRQSYISMAKDGLRTAALERFLSLSLGFENHFSCRL